LSAKAVQCRSGRDIAANVDGLPPGWLLWSVRLATKLVN